jgi:hypothetical protein
MPDWSIEGLTRAMDGRNRSSAATLQVGGRFDANFTDEIFMLQNNKSFRFAN